MKEPKLGWRDPEMGAPCANHPTCPVWFGWFVWQGRKKPILCVTCWDKANRPEAIAKLLAKKENEPIAKEQHDDAVRANNMRDKTANALAALADDIRLRKFG